MMVRSSDSAIKRLQVGLIGLLAVLLFVSLASMLTGRADGPGKADTTAGSAQATSPTGTKNDKDEPVVEMGVTPIVPEQPDKLPAKAAPASGATVPRQ
jgi:hypothetical protein